MKMGTRAVILVSSALLGGLPAGAEVVSLHPVRDNTLCEEPTGALSNGSGQHLFAGQTGSGSTRRGLLRFDVAGSIPPGSVVTSVQLRLNMSRTISGLQAVALRRALRDWGEGASNAAGDEGACAASAAGDATWVHTFFNTALWAAEGGDFAAAASASLTVGGVGSYEWGSTPEMVNDVQAWLDSPGDNFGWGLLGNEAGPGTAKRFDSRQHPVSSVRPVLTVTYSTPFSCEVALSYSAGTGVLTAGFEIGTPAPVMWNLWLTAGSSIVPLWNVAIPAIQPPVAFALPIPGFPRLGTIGFFQTFTTARGVVCSDAKLVDTGVP
jgi:hypothetical protein